MRAWACAFAGASALLLAGLFWGAGAAERGGVGRRHVAVAWAAFAVWAVPAVRVLGWVALAGVGF